MANAPKVVPVPNKEGEPLSFHLDLKTSDFITKRPTFTKHDSGKRRTSLIPPVALRLITEVLEHGARKYDDHNWARGANWSRYYDAAQRHLQDFWEGENLDPESKLPHLAHTLCCIMFLLHYEMKGVGVDDRMETNSPNRAGFGIPPVNGDTD